MESAAVRRPLLVLVEVEVNMSGVHYSTVPGTLAQSGSLFVRHLIVNSSAIESFGKGMGIGKSSGAFGRSCHVFRNYLDRFGKRFRICSFKMMMSFLSLMKSS
jgi:hypothetical protein